MSRELKKRAFNNLITPRLTNWILQIILMSVVKWLLATILIITAAVEGVRWSSIKREKSHLWVILGPATRGSYWSNCQQSW